MEGCTHLIDYIGGDDSFSTRERIYVEYPSENIVCVFLLFEFSRITLTPPTRTLKTTNQLHLKTITITITTIVEDRVKNKLLGYCR